MSGEKVEQESEDRPDAAEQHTDIHALPHARYLARADVLSAVGGGRRPERVKDAAEHHARLAACRDGGHVERAERVHSRLQDEPADRGDGILEPHGDPHRAELLYVPAVHAQMFPARMQDGKFLFDVPQAQKSRHALRQHCGDGGAHHVHLHYRDKEDVQDDVQHGRDAEKDHRRLTVAD